MKKYFTDIFQSIWTVLLGMKITFRHLFTRACTLQYPDQRWHLPERSRMRLFNLLSSEEKAEVCAQCSALIVKRNSTSSLDRSFCETVYLTKS